MIKTKGFKKNKIIKVGVSYLHLAILTGDLDLVKALFTRDGLDQKVGVTTNFLLPVFFNDLSSEQSQKWSQRVNKEIFGLKPKQLVGMLRDICNSIKDDVFIFFNFKKGAFEELMNNYKKIEEYLENAKEEEKPQEQEKPQKEEKPKDPLVVALSLLKAKLLNLAKTLQKK